VKWTVGNIFVKRLVKSTLSVQHRVIEGSPTLVDSVNLNELPSNKVRLDSSCTGIFGFPNTILQFTLDIQSST